MEEEKLLNETLNILGRGKILEAYNYISINKEKLKDLSSQVYNFLYCLASLTGKKMKL